MKNKTNKLAKLERNRKSIITDNLNQCYLCGGIKQDLHELIGGSNRLNSIKYGLVIPLCRFCHTKAHNDPELEKRLKQLGQMTFIQNYDEEFITIFKRNYL